VFQLDRDVLRALSRERFGTVDKLAQTAKIDRTTLHRWATGERLPVAPDGLIAVARALAVDPLILWRLDAALFDQAGRMIERVCRGRSWGALFGGLAYLDELLLPAREWPKRDTAETLALAWDTYNFTYRPTKARANYYGAVRVESLKPWQVWYFAYRNVTGINLMWQPYGLIMRTPTRLRLISLTAFTDLTIATETRAFDAETWLGPGAADFRICSLGVVRATFDPPTKTPTRVQFTLP
jgi:hypothetical protein